MNRGEGTEYKNRKGHKRPESSGEDRRYECNWYGWRRRRHRPSCTEQ